MPQLHTASTDIYACMHSPHTVHSHHRQHQLHCSTELKCLHQCDCVWNIPTAELHSTARQFWCCWIQSDGWTWSDVLSMSLSRFFGYRGILSPILIFMLVSYEATVLWPSCRCRPVSPNLTHSGQNIETSGHNASICCLSHIDSWQQMAFSTPFIRSYIWLQTFRFQTSHNA